MPTIASPTLIRMRTVGPSVIGHVPLDQQGPRSTSRSRRHPGKLDPADGSGRLAPNAAGINVGSPDSTSCANLNGAPCGTMVLQTPDLGDRRRRTSTAAAGRCPGHTSRR